MSRPGAAPAGGLRSVEEMVAARKQHLLEGADTSAHADLIRKALARQEKVSKLADAADELMNSSREYAQHCRAAGGGGHSAGSSPQHHTAAAASPDKQGGVSFTASSKGAGGPGAWRSTVSFYRKNDHHVYAIKLLPPANASFFFEGVERYSSLHKTHEEMRAFLGAKDCKGVGFPRRKLFGNRKENFAEVRCADFQTYFNSIAERERLREYWLQQPMFRKEEE